MSNDISATPLSRRTFIATTTAVGGATAAGGLLSDAPAEAAPATGVPTRAVSLEVNGRRQRVTVDTRTSLLDLLREDLDLTGTKKAVTRVRAGRARCWSTAAG